MSSIEQRNILNFVYGLNPDRVETNVIPLYSTCVGSTSWEFEGQGTGDLLINFTDGSSYVYHNVSPLVFHNLLRANSPGTYFNKYIRNNYDFTRQ